MACLQEKLAQKTGHRHRLCVRSFQLVIGIYDWLFFNLDYEKHSEDYLSYNEKRMSLHGEVNSEAKMVCGPHILRI